MIKSVQRYRRTILIVFLISGAVMLLARCNQKADKKTGGEQTKISYEQFAGSGKCMSCHKDIYDSHIRTAHYLTSAPATETE